MPISGLHHITAIASDPQANLDFYTGVLGLRLVKRTVNFDDPGTYHFYFGDEAGTPGTILTFFPWPGAFPGRPGSGMASAVAFSIPAGSLDFWMERFATRALDFDGPFERLGQPGISLRDPDGLHLELIEQSENDERLARWSAAGVPAQAAIESFHSVSLCLNGYEASARLLTETFGYETAGEEGDRFRFRSPSGAAGALADLRCQPDRLLRGQMGAGTIHHVAFRASDPEDQLAWREKLVEQGFNVTPALDRQYFRSIYFREPGGVLFEIATDPPGFTLDEEVGALGAGLKLPPWLEAQRPRIEKLLPEMRLGVRA